MLGAISSLFRSAPPSFSDYETAILDAIMAELAEPWRARLAQRLATVTHIRRTDGARQVSASQQVKRRVMSPEETRLTAEKGELLMARFTVISRRTLSALQGKAWVSDGQFSRLSFTQPTEHAQCDDVHRISVKLDDRFIALAAPKVTASTDQ